MRLYISHDKPYLISLLSEYTAKLLVGKKIDLIINGQETTGVVKSITLEDKPHNNLLIEVGETVHAVPILNDTKARLGKEMVRIETNNHTAIIEVLD